MDTDWIKAAAAQVRTTIKQAINKVDRIGNSQAGHSVQRVLDDALGAKTDPEAKKPRAETK